MSTQNPSKLQSRCAQERSQAILKLRDTREVAGFICGLLLLYFVFWGLDLKLHYIQPGAAIISEAKLRDEALGIALPKNVRGLKIAIFGNSRILAGFQSRHFDEMAAKDGIQTYSYNAGLPAREDFLPELKALEAAHDLPDLVLLTEPWRSNPPPRKQNIFALPISDHELADRLFPFRELVRNALIFAVNSRGRGGLRAFYRLAQENEAQMRADRGYFFIGDLSHYANESLPEDFRDSTDTPEQVRLRPADANADELKELNELVRRNSMICLYVPGPLRMNAAAPPPEVDEEFARVLTMNSPCRVAGPDYLRYPNSYFSDYIHLNHKGAAAYTTDLYGLVMAYVEQAHSIAVQ